MNIGNILLYSIYHSGGQTPSEIQISCVYSEPVMLAARFSTLFHQKWMEKVVETGRGIEFESEDDERTFALLNVDPCSCILGYRRVTIKIDTLVIQSIDCISLVDAKSVLDEVFQVLAREYKAIQWVGYVSYRWYDGAEESFKEFEVTNATDSSSCKNFVGPMLSSALNRKKCWAVLTERLKSADKYDCDELRDTLNAYKSWLRPRAYNELMALL